MKLEHTGSHASITMSKAELLALLEHVGSDHREHIHCVRFEAGGGKLCAVATDGARLVLAESPYGGEGLASFGLRADGLEAVAKLMRSKDDLVIRWPRGGDDVAECSVGLGLEVMRLPFPPWRQVLGNGNAMTPITGITIDARLLASVVKITTAVGYGRKTTHPVEFHFRGVLEPIHLKVAGDGTDWTCLLMPMRSDAGHCEGVLMERKEVA